jgi:hypothetical protein
MAELGTDTQRSTSTWSEVAPVSATAIGLVLIAICVALSFWVVFVALLIPVILIVMIAAWVMGSRSTPDQVAPGRDPADAGYQGPAAEYEVERESTTGDPGG